MNRAQRVVVTVGVGVALLSVGRSVELWQGASAGGYFAYAPLSTEAYPGAPFLVRHPGLRLVLWLVLALAWTVMSLRLFSDRPEPGPTAKDEGA